MKEELLYTSVMTYEGEAEVLTSSVLKDEAWEAVKDDVLERVYTYSLEEGLVPYDAEDGVIDAFLEGIWGEASGGENSHEDDGILLSIHADRGEAWLELGGLGGDSFSYYVRPSE